MALSSLSIAHGDHKQLVGGVESIHIWEQVYSGWAATDTATATTIASGGVTGAIPTTAGNVSDIKFQVGTAKVDFSTAQEKGLALTTISIEGYVPNLSKENLAVLQEMAGKALMGCVHFYNDTDADAQRKLLVGWDNVLGTKEASGDYIHSKFALFLDSVEASSGAAITDQHGATLKFTAVQGETPYEYIHS
jgi:hypothetical protein